MFAAAQAQSQAPTPTNLPAVSISGRSAGAPIALGGFGDTANARLPLQALSLDAERLRELGSAGLSALPLLDASISDAYNAIGYWASLRVRGFEVDNRFNLRRDGLPINGETGFDLFNKDRLEVLKGSSGLQAGISSPAGLINLVTKRADRNRLDLSLGYESPGTWSAAVDWAHRDSAMGWRLNAITTQLDPWLRHAQGERHGLALASDWRLSPTTLLDAELEATHQVQPSQPGFSLLGNTLPSPTRVDRRLNLNGTDWRLPVAFDNRFASVRLRQQLASDWQLSLQAGLQQARTDDRVAFPYGCYAENAYDRYCSDGSFDLYDFRSNGERRNTHSLRAVLDGQLHGHQLRAELLSSRFQADFQRQAYNWAGSGSVFGGNSSQADPSLTDENTLRREWNQELALSDQVQTGRWTWFGGLRATRAHRASVRTDGSRPTAYTATFTTPWLGASWALGPNLRAYASAGQGLETEVAPNRARYRNAGEALVLKSRQVEIGLKAGSHHVDWSVAAFDTRRPAWSDLGSCDLDATCTRQADGEARHRGLEAQTDLKWQGGGLLASAMWLQARREGAQDASLNGRPPVNVPARQFRLQLREQLAPQLQGSVQLSHEGSRAVLPDDSLRLPAWTRADAKLHWEHRHAGQNWRWQLGVDNLFDRKAWKESPLQFGHVYLFPLAPRTVRLGLDLAL